MFRSIDLSSTNFKDRKNHFYEIMIYELPEPPAKAVFCFVVERGKMSVILALGIALCIGAIAYFWNQIRDSYLNTFAPWIEKICGDEIKHLCDVVFIGIDENVRFIRRNIKGIRELFQNVICKYDLAYTVKTPEHTEITETVVVQKQDGSFVQMNAKSTVDNDELPFEILNKMHESDDSSVFINGKEIIEKKISDALSV